MSTMIRLSFVCVLSLSLSGSALASNWVTFSDQTATRLQTNPSLGASDIDEKSYAWGDVDQDGDVDLVVARKQPMASLGLRPNLLLMNEGGVLVDRTAQYASASDVPGDQGLLTPTNNRDVKLADVNGDGWLDIITATTYGQGMPQHISHPRVYINLKKVGGVWQGFRYETARIPQIGNGPNFCFLAVGDVNGDGAPDLYFVDYDHLTTSVLDDRLLINNGLGFFTDETDARVSPSFSTSDFGTACWIVDLNGDGKRDIVKSQNGPLSVAYNNGTGAFNQIQTPSSATGSSYHVSVADLNGDGRMDLITSDDGVDRVHINQSTAGSGVVNWLAMSLPASTSGFGSNSYSVDLDNDGKLDVLIASVDVRDDPPGGCPGRAGDIIRNVGTTGSPTFNTDSGNIPDSMLMNVFDYAIFDIDGDCWKDLVVGRCTGTQVWIQQPPTGATICSANPCPADLDASHVVNGLDLAQLLGAWSGAVGYSPCPPYRTADLNHDCKVNGLDLASLLGAWGPCQK